MTMMLALAAGFSLAKGAEAQAPELVVLPDWLAGCWVSESAEEWTEECWTTPRGGVVLGSNRSGKTGAPDAVANWEMMQIGPLRPEAPVASRGLAFRASLKGSAWVAFEGKADRKGGLIFTNTAHDYPQRIRYWREGEALRAEISLADGTEATSWTFRRMGEGKAATPPE